MSDFKLSKTSVKNMEGVDLRWHYIINKALQISTIDFGIPQLGGKRTVDEQKHLFSQGASLCDGIDKKSTHQLGMALDVYAYVDGKASWKTEHLTIVACAILQAANLLGHRVAWGGFFTSFMDMPHFEIRH